MKKLDMTGNPCPIPVVQAKKALAEADTTVVEVTVDNEVAVQNLKKMADGMGHGFAHRKAGDERWVVEITKGAGGGGACEVMPVEAVVDAPGGVGPTVLITGQGMGSGADELGRMLMKGFIFSLTELSPAPRAVIFLNGGAKLTTEGANTVPDLKALEAKGVEILTCGTCANYFELTEKLAVGAITDMMGITSRLAAAGRLISL